MPIYDYRCDHCGHVFSAVQSFKDEALEKCPNCGKKPRRLLRRRRSSSKARLVQDRQPSRREELGFEQLRL
jgi:putative FmdB family regulatory protein